MYEITKCPLRITIAPSGGDSPRWCNEGYIGHSYTAAIDKYVYVLACKSPVPEYKLCYSEIESVNSLNQVKHSILKKLLPSDEYWSIITWSDLPARAGLGSSAAFTIALIRSMQYRFDEKLFRLYKFGSATPVSSINLQDVNANASDLAMYAYNLIKTDDIGPQDEFAVSFANVNKFTFSYDRDGNWIVDREEYKDNGWYLYLLDSGKRRLASKVLKKVHDYYGFYEYRRKVEEMGRLAFESYLDKQYEKYKMILCDYNDLKYKVGALTSCDYATLTVLSREYACKSVGAGDGGFYLIISENEIDEERVKYGSLIPISICTQT